MFIRECSLRAHLFRLQPISSLIPDNKRDHKHDPGYRIADGNSHNAVDAGENEEYPKDPEKADAEP